MICRGIQGFVAGIIMATAFTAMGDLFSPRERGRWPYLKTKATHNAWPLVKIVISSYDHILSNRHV